MKQDMIVVLDLGSEENPRLAREIRALGVYTEIHPHDITLAELKALKQQNAQRDADEAVTLALKAGKITPAQKDWARSYALADPKGFGAFVEKAPQVVPMGEIDLGGGVALKSAAPDEATTLVCKQLGVSQEDLEKYGKEE